MYKSITAEPHVEIQCVWRVGDKRKAAGWGANGGSWIGVGKCLASITAAVPRRARDKPGSRDDGREASVCGEGATSASAKSRCPNRSTSGKRRPLPCRHVIKTGHSPRHVPCLSPPA